MKDCVGKAAKGAGVTETSEKVYARRTRTYEMSKVAYDSAVGFVVYLN